MGWLVWQRSQTPSTTTQNVTPVETATDSPATVDPQAFRLTEWGVTAKNTSAYTLQYKITSDNRYADFTAKELIDATGACPVENAPSGRIARYAANETVTDPGAASTMTATERAAAYEANAELKDHYKKVGDYYYFFIPPQAACSEQETQMQENVTAAVHDLLKTFGQ
jgi:hypothetical protein